MDNRIDTQLEDQIMGLFEGLSLEQASDMVNGEVKPSKRDYAKQFINQLDEQGHLHSISQERDRQVVSNHINNLFEETYGQFMNEVAPQQTKVVEENVREDWITDLADQSSSYMKKTTVLDPVAATYDLKSMTKDLTEHRIAELQNQINSLRMIVSEGTMVSGIGQGGDGQTPGSGEVEVLKMDDVSATGISIGEHLVWDGFNFVPSSTITTTLSTRDIVLINNPESGNPLSDLFALGDIIVPDVFPWPEVLIHQEEANEVFSLTIKYLYDRVAKINQTSYQSDFALISPNLVGFNFIETVDRFPSVINAFEFEGIDGITLNQVGKRITISGIGDQGLKLIGLLDPDVNTWEDLDPDGTVVSGNFYIFNNEGDFIGHPNNNPIAVIVGDLYVAVPSRDGDSNLEWVYIANPFGGSVASIQVEGDILELGGTDTNPIISLTEDNVVIPSKNTLRNLVDTQLNQGNDQDIPMSGVNKLDDGSFLRYSYADKKWKDYVIREGEFGDTYKLGIIQKMVGSNLPGVTTGTINLYSTTRDINSELEIVGLKGTTITTKNAVIASDGVTQLDTPKVYIETINPRINLDLPVGLPTLETNSAYLTLFDEGRNRLEEVENPIIDIVQFKGAGGIVIGTNRTEDLNTITISAEDVVGTLRFLGLVTRRDPAAGGEDITEENLPLYTNPSSSSIPDLRRGDYYVFKFDTKYNGVRAKAGDLLMRSQQSWEVIHKNTNDMYLDGLIDVNLAGSANESMDYLYYIRKDAGLSDSDGRFTTDILDGELHLNLHRYDLQGNDVATFDPNLNEPELSPEILARRLNTYSTSVETEVRVKHIFRFPNNQRFELNLISIATATTVKDDPSSSDLTSDTPLSYRYSYVVNEEAAACFEALNLTSNGFTINSRAEYGLGDGDVLTYMDGRWVAAPGTGSKYKMETEAVEMLEDDGTTILYGVNLNLLEDKTNELASTVEFKGYNGIVISEYSNELQSVINISADDVVGTEYTLRIAGFADDESTGAAQSLSSTMREDQLITHFVGVNGIGVTAQSDQNKIVIDGSEILKSTNYLGQIEIAEIELHYNPISNLPNPNAKPITDPNPGDYYFVSDSGFVHPDPGTPDDTIQVYTGDTFIYDESSGWTIISTASNGVNRIDVSGGLLYLSGSQSLPTINLDTSDVITPSRHNVLSLTDVYVPDNNPDLIANKSSLIYDSATGDWHPRVVEPGGIYRLDASSPGGNAVSLNLIQTNTEINQFSSSIRIEGSGLIRTTQSGPNAIRISLSELGGGLENLGTINPSEVTPDQVMSLPVWDEIGREPRGGDFFLFDSSGPWVEPSYDKEQVVGGDMYLYTTDNSWMVINRNLYVAMNDLIDVNVDTRIIPGITRAEYYVNADPDLDGGWGRYMAASYDKEGGGINYEMTINKFDIRTNDINQDTNVRSIFDGAVPGVTIHVYELLDSVGNVQRNGRYEVRVESKGTDTNTYTFNYTEERDSAALIEALSASGASIPFRLSYYDTEGLENGDILVYDNRVNQWLPQEAPGGRVIQSDDEPLITKAGDFWYDRSKKIMSVSDSQQWNFVAEGLQTVIDTTAPEFPVPGQFWIDREDFKMYVWYEGRSEDTNEIFADWVQVGSTPGQGQGGGVPDDETCELDGGLADGTGGSCFEGGNRVTVSDQPPTLNSEVGDMWVDTDGYYLYTWTGIKWVALTTTMNETPYQAASPIHYSTIAPDGPTPGNLWFDIGDGDLKIYIADSNTTQWVSITSNSGAERSQEIVNDINENEYAIQAQSVEVASLKTTIETLQAQLENLQNQVIDLIGNQ